MVVLMRSVSSFIVISASPLPAMFASSELSFACLHTFAMSAPVKLCVRAASCAKSTSSDTGAFFEVELEDLFPLGLPGR